MGMTRRTLAAVMLAAPLVVAACHHDRRADVQGGKFTKRDPTRPLGPGDIRIVNTDSSIELALIGDSIVGGLGRKALDEVRSNTDTSDVTGNGVAASIEKLVKGAVADALNQELVYPVSDVKDVRYENGRLEFYSNSGSRLRIFDNSHENGRRVSETFRPDDAERFVAAFRARKARGA
jgi:hypothetical protein